MPSDPYRPALDHRRWPKGFPAWRRQGRVPGGFQRASKLLQYHFSYEAEYTPFAGGPSPSPAAKKEFTTERTETTEKSTSARAGRDNKVTVPCLLTHSLRLHVFSVTSVA